MMATAAQCAVLMMALKAGDPHGLPETLAALVMSESSAGLHLVGDGGRSVGVGHMKPGTALEVLARHPYLWAGKPTRKAVRHRLLTDTRWALEVKAQHLADLVGRYGWADGIRAYKAGEAGMRRGGGYRGLQVVRDFPGVAGVCR